MTRFVINMIFHYCKRSITYVELKGKKDNSYFLGSFDFKLRAKTSVFFSNLQKKTEVRHGEVIDNSA